MSIKLKRMWTALIVFISVFGSQMTLMAQEADKPAAQASPGFMKIVFGGGAPCHQCAR